MIKVTVRAFCRSIGPNKKEPFMLEKAAHAGYSDVAAIKADPTGLGNMVADLLEEYGSDGVIINFTFDHSNRMG